ncbi:MAG TPA: lipid A biosynthesis acyltransferase [Gammaproteobacteria bacterium]|nr:lipid A biosynthesis acyltransferase [Gammaproteobacteria bacterium]
MAKFILIFFSIFPLRVNHFFGYLIGRCLYLFNTESKKVVTKNISLCFPKLSAKSQRNLIKENLIETGKGLSESGFIWLNNFNHNATHVHKIQDKSFAQTDGPIIFLTPHFGCWELTARMISRFRPVTFLYKPLRKIKEEAFLLSMRAQHDLFMAPANKKGIFKLQRALSTDGAIGILPDQDPGERGGILSPFFGHNAQTMTLLAKLARKNDAKVVLAWCERLNLGRGYELNFQSVDVLSESGNLEDDVALMNKVIENLVKTKPEQYLWNYKRFKSEINYRP